MKRLPVTGGISELTNKATAFPFGLRDKRAIIVHAANPRIKTAKTTDSTILI